MNTPALKQYYNDVVVAELKNKFGFKNVHVIPRVDKIVLNSGFTATADKAHVAYVNEEMKKLAGQRPVTTRAKLSISNFKLREGQPIGVKVTLRGAAMYDFLMRLINIALPCIRDFRGVPTKLDGKGNYTLGITDHTIFPEISVESAGANLGLDVCIVTTATNDEEGRELLRLLGMPFRKTAAEQAAADAAQSTAA
jgi:large subunit ribosomal protein L5